MDWCCQTGSLKSFLSFCLWPCMGGVFKGGTPLVLDVAKNEDRKTLSCIFVKAAQPIY